MPNSSKNFLIFATVPLFPPLFSSHRHVRGLLPLSPPLRFLLMNTHVVSVLTNNTPVSSCRAFFSPKLPFLPAWLSFPKHLRSFQYCCFFTNTHVLFPTAAFSLTLTSFSPLLLFTNIHIIFSTAAFSLTLTFFSSLLLSSDHLDALA